MTSLHRRLLYLFSLLIIVTTCYAQHNQLAKECGSVSARLDVLFLLDGSGSVSGGTFDMQMEMLMKVTELVEKAHNQSRIAVMQYAGYTRIEIGFRYRQTKDQMKQALQKIRHMSGSTKTGRALEKAAIVFKEEQFKRANENVKQVAIVVSDGHSHDDPSRAADALRQQGVTILSLGIGHHINRAELVDITGDEHNVFQDLHKEINLNRFISSFKNISYVESCKFVRGENGAEITCHEDYFQLQISTVEELKGSLYVISQLAYPECISSGSVPKVAQSSFFDAELSVSYRDCGVQKSYMAFPLGVLYTTRVVLQYHPVLATSNDTVFDVQCFQKTSKKSSKPRIEGVTTKTENDLEDSASPMRPPCHYDVTPRVSPCGKGMVVGDELTHRWTCDYESLPPSHSLFVHSCQLVDYISRQSYQISDEKGCILNPSLLTDVEHSSDGLTVTAKGVAVRFAGSPLVTYQCKIKMCADCMDTTGCRAKRETAADDVDKEPSVDYPSGEILFDEDELSLPEPAQRNTIQIQSVSASPVSISGRVVDLNSSKWTDIISKKPSSDSLVHGGVDVVLNTQSVAVVKDDNIRNKFKQALRIHEGLPISISPLVLEDELQREESIVEPTTVQMTPALSHTLPATVTTDEDSLLSAELDSPHLIVFTTIQPIEVDTITKKNTPNTEARITTPLLPSVQPVRPSSTVPVLFPTLMADIDEDQQGIEISLEAWSSQEDVVIETLPLLVQLPKEQFSNLCTMKH